MEMKRNEKDEILMHGDVRLPEVIDELKGPSRTRMLVHLGGIGLGLLLLLVGVGLGLSRNMWDKLALIPTIAGGALIAGWFTSNYRYLASAVRNRRVMVGTNAVFMAMLAVTLLVLANFVAYRHYRKWDMTVAGKFTLSPKTDKILADLSKDVEVITVTLRRRTGQTETALRVKDMMRLYTERTKRVTSKIVEPDVDPSQVQILNDTYGIALTSPNDYDTVYVVTGGKEGKKKAVHLREMMDYERDPDNPYGPAKPTTFKGEKYVTSAIVEVTETKQPKVYFLSGHGERSITDPTPVSMLDLANNLKRDNLAIETLASIPSTGVPADCDALIIMAPAATMARDEVERVRQYLDRGGRLLIAEDIGQISGLEPLLVDWGVRFGNDAVISQDSRTLLGSPVAFVATDFGDQEITRPLSGFTVVFNFARSVTAIPDSTGRLEVTPLIMSSKASYAETDLATLLKVGNSSKDPAADVAGPVTLAVAVQERPAQAEGSTEPAKTARIVAFGDADAFSNDVLGQAYKNVDLARNAVNWLLDRQQLIAIDARPETQHVLAVDQAAKSAVLLIVVIGLPLLVLLIGGVVWAVRSYGSRA